MRRLGCAAVVIGLVACGDPGPDEGAILTLVSPAGPLAATRIEVVLANASPDAISDVDHQRREPGSRSSETVRYYRQRALGGVVDGMKGVSGFELRIEPDLTISTDEAFIPFVFVYDGATLVGVGNVEDAAGAPAPVAISPGMITSYTVVVTPVNVLSDDDAPIERGTLRTVSCGREASGLWTSGVAWFPIADPALPSARQHQLRLLLPDLAADATATDATARAADLDCDQHPAADSDCDDLRTAYFSGAPDSCDGFDTNCDAQHFVPQGCNSVGSCTVTPGTSSGVQICDDETGTLGQCTPSAACLCTDGSTCAKCTIDFMGNAANSAACSPSVGRLSFQMCGALGCTIEVAGATNGWRAFISTAETGPFGTILTNAHGPVFVEAKLGQTLPVTLGSIGEIYFLVTPANSPTVTVPIQLEMKSPSQCTPIPNGMGTSRMTCSP